MSWKPIETAPKDGTVIDLIVNGKHVPNAYWSFSVNADGHYMVNIPEWVESIQ